MERWEDPGLPHHQWRQVRLHQRLVFSSASPAGSFSSGSGTLLAIIKCNSESQAIDFNLENCNQKLQQQRWEAGASNLILMMICMIILHKYNILRSESFAVSPVWSFSLCLVEASWAITPCIASWQISWGFAKCSRHCRVFIRWEWNMKLAGFNSLDPRHPPSCSWSGCFHGCRAGVPSRGLWTGSEPETWHLIPLWACRSTG